LYFYGARWYDSYLNRWAQPDSIVPLATQGTQALDRYAYANNNPVKFTDPSGHCTGDPNDINNRNDPCWLKWRRINEKYSEISVGTDFTLSELDYLLQALDWAARAFGGEGKFQAATGAFIINKGTQRGAPSGMFKVVTLHGDDFSVRQGNDIYLTILHEIGHIFDFNGAGLNPSKYKSAEFVAKLNTVDCTPGWLGCVGDDPLYGFVNYETGGKTFGGTWDPSIPPMRDYGLRSSVDDFADSFAAYVLNVNGITEYQIDPFRKSMLQSNFALHY
jgi:hypothetical protein